MKLEIAIMGITAFFIANTYYDNKYIEYLKSLQKYWRMATFAFAGLSVYLLIRKKPGQTNNILKSLGGVIRYMPIDHNAKAVFEPFIDMTANYEAPQPLQKLHEPLQHPENVRHKRSVSDARKKYVASTQKWRCGSCNVLLDATYEIDHIRPLHQGGDNEVSNLVALCRPCHAKKTLESRI